MEVPALFVENFDYQNLRPDFLNGILTSDLLGKSVSCTIVGDQHSRFQRGNSSRAQPWAACVGDLASYAQISKAVISRWSYPLTLDETIPGDSERYEQRRGRLYVGKSLCLARSCIIGPAAVIGNNTSVGDLSTISHSVIGAYCRIGNKVNISHSFVMLGAYIGNGCTISNSMIAEGVHVNDNTQIEDGSLAGPGVIIGEDAIVKGRRISVEPWRPGAVTTNGVAAELGTGSQGHIWPTGQDAWAEDYDSDDEDGKDPRNVDVALLYSLAEDGNLSSSSSISTISRFSSSSSLRSDASDALSNMSAISEPPAIAGIAALDSSEASEDIAFDRECISSLDRSFSEKHTVENAAIELKTLRMASNVPLKRVVGVVVPYLCNQVKFEEEASVRDVSTAVNELVERWGALVTSLTSGQVGGMVEVLLALQLHCASNAVHQKMFAAFLQSYYNEDVVSEEAAVSWVKNPNARSIGGDAGKRLWQTGAAFVKALMEAEEDSEEDNSE